MLIGFIGCPSSGKTTTAAMTFADLKNLGISSEFIPEQARLYIAEKRLERDQIPGSSVSLDVYDQIEILHRQRLLEDTLVRSSGSETIVITDSCVFNTLMYISPSNWELMNNGIIWDVRNYLPRYDLLFYCGPVKMPTSRDVNRIHDEKQSLEIDKRIRETLPSFGIDPIQLLGDSKQRHHEVTKAILEKNLG